MWMEKYGNHITEDKIRTREKYLTIFQVGRNVISVNGIRSSQTIFPLMASVSFRLCLLHGIYLCRSRPKIMRGNIAM